MMGPAQDEVWLAGLGGHLARAGFLLAGGFSPRPGDGVPPMRDGTPAASVLVVGSLSNALLPILKSRPEWHDGLPDPLDRYTRAALSEIAAEEGLGVVFPFDGPPWFPFQRWALRVGGFSPSPMGVLAHLDFGPWLGLRAALLSPEPFVAPTTGANPAPGPCETCEAKPCIAACPAGALTVDVPSASYDVPRCLAYLARHPEAACQEGCRARHACPVGTRHRQTAVAGTFHMAALTRQS